MTNIEKEIANRIAKANGLSITRLGLRFDKVVIRLCENLRVYAEQEIPKGETVVMTLTAPIKLPAKTEVEIKRQIKDFVGSGIRHADRTVTIFQNTIRLRIIGPSLKQPIKFVGFVHNPGSDPKQLLDLANQWLLT